MNKNRHSSLKPTDLKSENKSSILRYVYHNGTTSKPDLSKILGISKPTASVLIDELVNSGFFKTEGIGQSTSRGGKRPLLFNFNYRARTVIALSIGVGTLEGALVDLGINILSRKRVEISTDSVGEAIHKLVSLAKSLVDYSCQLGLEVLGIGVSAPGVIESMKGVLVKSANLEGWADVPVGQYLGSELGLPIWLDNESRNIALAENWFGQGKNLNTFITLQTKGGLGAGIIINKIVYRGIDDSGGEFGHTTIDLKGPSCGCGNTGCWELYATDSAFLKLFQKASINYHQDADMNYRLIVESYEKGDSETQNLVKQYASYLGIGIVNMVNVFNPEVVFLHGNLHLLGIPFLKEIESIVKRKAVPPASERVQIRFSTLGQDAVIIGAATLVIKEAIEGHLLIASAPAINIGSTL